MKHLPKVELNWINELEKEMEEVAKGGQLLEWLGTQLRELTENNPNLHSYITVHARTFAHGMAMPQTPQSVAISQLLETVRLLSLLNLSYNKQIEKEKWHKKWNGVLNGIPGLEDFGGKE
jgi:hypothetical protein